MEALVNFNMVAECFSYFSLSSMRPQLHLWGEMAMPCWVLLKVWINGDIGSVTVWSHPSNIFIMNCLKTKYRRTPCTVISSHSYKCWHKTGPNLMLEKHLLEFGTVCKRNEHFFRSHYFVWLNRTNALCALKPKSYYFQIYDCASVMIREIEQEKKLKRELLKQKI